MALSQLLTALLLLGTSLSNLSAKAATTTTHFLRSPSNYVQQFNEPIPLSRCERSIPVLQIIPATLLPSGHLVPVHPAVLSTLVGQLPQGLRNVRQIQSAVINQNAGGRGGFGRGGFGGGNFGNGGFGHGGFGHGGFGGGFGTRPSSPTFVNVNLGREGTGGFGRRPFLLRASLNEEQEQPALTDVPKTAAVIPSSEKKAASTEEGARSYGGIVQSRGMGIPAPPCSKNVLISCQPRVQPTLCSGGDGCAVKAAY